MPESEIDDLDFVQSADTLYITHPDHHPTKITRTSHTAWTLAEIVLEKGPFRAINDTATLTLAPSSFSGAATAYGTQQVGRTFTLTASSATFNSGHIGSLWRLRESSVDGERRWFRRRSAIAPGLLPTTTFTRRTAKYTASPTSPARRRGARSIVSQSIPRGAFASSQRQLCISTPTICTLAGA